MDSYFIDLEDVLGGLSTQQLKKLREAQKAYNMRINGPLPFGVQVAIAVSVPERKAPVKKRGAGK